MRFDLFPHSKPFNMKLGIHILRPVHLRFSIFDSETKRIYIDRKVRLFTSGMVAFKLPLVPDELTVEIVDQNLPRAKSAFRVDTVKINPDTKCPLDLTEEDKAFIRFAKWFATESSRLEIGAQGTLYQSEGFTIHLVDTIRESGIELTTPARISRSNGIIEVSQKRTLDFTVPMLLVMLLHEYAHKYKNKEYGKEESNELTADLIACHIALNLGFDPHEVAGAFEDVFAIADSNLNRKRMAAINEFIEIFNQSEPTRCNLKK